MPDHLIPAASDRGFDRMPPIPSEYGGEVTVYESSAASGPHVWLKVREAIPGEPVAVAHVHLTAGSAWRLSEQLQHLVRNHYQGDATPEGSAPVPVLLAAIANALRNGSHMTNANLAFAYLCDALGIGEDDLPPFDPSWSDRA